MKILVLICALMLTLSAMRASVVETRAFEEARPVGTFFLFSTAYGRYVIRQDGMGEVTFGARRRAFWLKRGMVGRIEKLYFHEYQGDLLLLYEVSDGGGYVGRMNQQARKMRWLTPVNGDNIGPCVVEADQAHCGPVDHSTKIDLNTGAHVQD
jgi:hypothetical protein